MNTHCHFSIHTLLCLSVSLFVCFHPINVKTAEPIELNIFETTYGRFMAGLSRKKTVKNVERKRIFATNSNCFPPIYPIATRCRRPLIFQTMNFNIIRLHQLVAKNKRLENLSLWQKLNSFIIFEKFTNLNREIRKNLRMI